MAKPTPEQLAKINQKALVPLTDEQTHVFQARIIGTKRIDKYKMKITPNFLRKMADQVKEGVALLVDHPWQKWEALSFPYGRTFDSRIVEEAGELELYGDHYMAKGLEANGISTDQLATGIDSGTIFDTSAGFVTTKHICGICGGNYYGPSACSHIRGQMYDDKECLVLADDGYIMENSIVFDGGYEGAGITRESLSMKQHSEGEQPKRTEYEPLPLDTKSLDGDGRDPLADLDSWSLRFRGSGARPVKIIANKKVDIYLKQNAKIRELIKYTFGKDVVTDGSLAEIVSQNLNGLKYEVYDGGYIDDSGVFYPFIPDNAVIIIGQGMTGSIMDLVTSPNNYEDIFTGHTGKFALTKLIQGDPDQWQAINGATVLPRLKYVNWHIFATVA